MAAGVEHGRERKAAEVAREREAKELPVFLDNLLGEIGAGSFLCGFVGSSLATARASLGRRGCRGSEALPDVLEEASHLRTGEAVEDHSPGAARANHAGRSEKAKSLRDRRLGKSHGCGQIAHAELLPDQQRFEDPRARRVGEEAEHFGQPFDLGLRGQLSPRRSNALRVHDLDGAGIE